MTRKGGATSHLVRWMVSGWLILADADLLSEKNTVEWLADKHK
jgi:hypothetical protein